MNQPPPPKKRKKQRKIREYLYDSKLLGNLRHKLAIKMMLLNVLTAVWIDPGLSNWHTHRDSNC